MLRHVVVLSIILVFVAGFAVQAQEIIPDISKKETETYKKDRDLFKAVVALQEAFNRGDAKAMAACWTSDGEFIGPNGEQIFGQKKIEAAFSDFFAKNPKAKMQFSGVSHRPIANGVVLIDFTAEMTPIPDELDARPNSTMLLVKQEGRWFIARMHEAVGVSPSPKMHLQALKGYVGEWIEERARPSGVVVHSSCDWTANGSYLIRKFSAKGEIGIVKAGTEVIGWDPRQHRIRSWIFDADGGFGESVWTRDGTRWVIKHTGTLADGNDVSVTYIVTPTGPDTLTIQSKDHIVGGEKQPDLPEIKLKRVVVDKQAKPKSSESPKTPAKVLP